MADQKLKVLYDTALETPSKVWIAHLVYVAKDKHKSLVSVLRIFCKSYRNKVYAAPH